jgi:hypothetical protein
MQKHIHSCNLPGNVRDKTAAAETAIKHFRKSAQELTVHRNHAAAVKI